MTSEEIERFRQDGVIVLRNFFSPETVSKMEGELEGYVETMAPGLTGAFIDKKAEDSSLRGLSWINMFSPYFAEVLEKPALARTIEQLAGWTPRSFFADAFRKPANDDTITPFHQDIAYTAVTPHQQATIWAPIDPVRADNGAVRYWAGSHKAGLQDHESRSCSKWTLAVPQSDAYEEIQVDLEPGDVLVHDGLVMHGSGPNTTNGPRRAVAFGYRGISTEIGRSII